MVFILSKVDRQFMVSLGIKFVAIFIIVSLKTETDH